MVSKQLLQASVSYLNQKSVPIIDLNGVEYIRIKIPIRKIIGGGLLMSISFIAPDLCSGYYSGKAVMNPVDCGSRFRCFSKDVSCMGLPLYARDRGLVCVRNVKKKYKKVKRIIIVIGGFFR